ncbi:MAG: response regulator transcription factor [Ruminococcaceae bacterium]|nr:response regulator transcription factor [Oscillospiraceae bacterium]MBR3595754.1 response regulator transcription factor [Clostridia bacterium]
MKIVICDDENNYVEEIKYKVNDILASKNVKSEVDVYTDSEALYQNGEFYNMAFLDVEMTPFSGIEIAHKLKDINPYIIIFIITSYDKYLDDAMDLNVFRYINKPINFERLQQGVIKALESIDGRIITFFLKNGSTALNILSDDIVYIETVGRNTRVITTKGEFISENKIDFWKEKLVASFFYRVHKSFIINMKHISDYKRDTVGLLGIYSVPIAYRKQADFRRFFFDYFGGR